MGKAEQQLEPIIESGGDPTEALQAIAMYAGEQYGNTKKDMALRMIELGADKEQALASTEKMGTYGAYATTFLRELRQ